MTLSTDHLMLLAVLALLVALLGSTLGLALATFPVLKRVVLINPLVYASEGFRSALVPAFPHLPQVAILAALVLFNVTFLSYGLRQFRRKAVT